MTANITYLDRQEAKNFLEAEGFVRVPAPNNLIMYFKGDQLAKVITPNILATAKGENNNTTIGYQTISAEQIAIVQAKIDAAK